MHINVAGSIVVLCKMLHCDFKNNVQKNLVKRQKWGNYVVNVFGKNTRCRLLHVFWRLAKPGAGGMYPLLFSLPLPIKLRLATYVRELDIGILLLTSFAWKEGGSEVRDS